MSRSAAVRITDSGRFPRVSGDEPDLITVDDFTVTFSPRERG